MMRAVAFFEFGAPDVLQVIERPMPSARLGEVVVKIVATTVNPTDIMMRDGRQTHLMTELTPPYIPGMEFSGFVHAAGEGVTLTVGTRVIGVVNPRRPDGGAHAEYIRVPAASVAPIIDNVDIVGAATVPMNALTANLALAMLGLSAKQIVLITGGAGMLGGSAIQLAHHAGLHVLTIGRDDEVDMLRALGADVILPRNGGLIEALRIEAPQGVDGMIDGALIGNSISHAIRDGGTAVSLRMSHPIDDRRLKTPYVSVIDGMERQDLLVVIAKLINSGALVPRIAPQGVMPFADAVAAHKRTEETDFRGRIVLSFED